jgi:peptidylprolyl isomerase
MLDRPARLVSLLALLPVLAHAASSGSPGPSANASVAASSRMLAPTEVIAQAGSIELGSTDVQALVGALPIAERSAVSGSLDNLEQVIRAELVRRAVLAEAKAKGFERQPDAVAQLDKLRDDALVRLWVANHSQVPAGYPTDEDLKSAYEANKSALAATATEYHLAQIFISAPDGGDPAKIGAALRKATDLAAKVAGSDFAKLAREQSEHADSAAKGGDLGYLPQARMLPEIAAAVRDMKPGDVLGPVKTAQGLHFVKLLDKRSPVPTLAEAHDTLVTVLRARRAQELQQAYLVGLNGQLGVTVNQIALAKLQQTLK